MLLGILSDTHDRLEAASAALALLKSKGAEFFIHCGDVGGQQIIDLFAGLPCALVWGNNDYDRAELAQYAQNLGISIHPSLAGLTFANKKIAVTHGDDFPLMRRIESGQQYDYLFHGHTHVPRDQRVGRLRIINPGALHRAAKKTIALLDPAADTLEFLTVPLS
jgi:hypothetical protein